MEDLLQIQDTVTIPAPQFEAMLRQLQQLQVEVASLKQPDHSTHWKDQYNNWTSYPELKSDHLLNILNGLYIKKNERAPYVVAEVDRRWGQLRVNINKLEKEGEVLEGTSKYLRQHGFSARGNLSDYTAHLLIVGNHTAALKRCIVKTIERHLSA